MPEQKIEELGYLSKPEKVKLNIMYSGGRAVYGFIQNLSKASGLSKKKVENFLQTQTSYTKFGPPTRCFRRLQAFSKYIIKIWWMGFCRQISESKHWSQGFIICCRYFSKIFQSSNSGNKVCQRNFTSFQKIDFSKKTLLKNFGLIKEQNMGELLKNFAGRKTLKFNQQ